MKLDPDQRNMQQTQLVVWLVGAGLTLIAWTWSDAAFALSVALGGTISGLNLFILARAVRKLLSGQSASWGFVAAIKFLALMGVTFLALRHEQVNALGFALGIAALPVGICVSTLFFSGDPPDVAPLNANPNPLLDRTVNPSSAETDHA
jgi:uncharacterized membrane protein